MLEDLRAIGGAEEDRTPDLLCARQVLSQLSYGPPLLPTCGLLGETRLRVAGPSSMAGRHDALNDRLRA